MTDRIRSFSYRHGLTKSPTGHGFSFVFDFRSMPNPYWDESLRGYTGRDKPIADFFDRIPARSVYFAERMAELLTGTDGVEVEVMYAAKSHWKVSEPENLVSEEVSNVNTR